MHARGFGREYDQLSSVHLGRPSDVLSVLGRDLRELLELAQICTSSIGVRIFLDCFFNKALLKHVARALVRGVELEQFRFDRGLHCEHGCVTRCLVTRIRMLCEADSTA